MKRFRTILIGLLTLIFSVSAMSCKTDDTGKVPTPPIDPPIVTEYVSSEKSPEYPAISDTIKYTTYYFDSVSGDDSRTGLTKELAKKSLIEASGMIKSITAKNPTKILFKAGSEYTGKFVVEKFKAMEESPLIIGVYDKTETAKYVKINGNLNDNCVEIKAGNLRFSSFECTAPKGYRGIHVTTQLKGAFKNLVISDCYCHDINYNTAGVTLPTDGSMPDSATVQKVCEDGRFSYNCGGIILEADTPKAKGESWYENVWIDDNIVEKVARTGIWVFSNWAQRVGVDWGKNPYYDDETNWFHHSNVNIRRNQILYSGGDGIILGVTVGGFIEGNVSFHSQFLGRANYYCAAIWIHSCKKIVMQYNEASYTHTGRDGQGFDIDIGNSEIIFQYNYSHHNDGGGVLCCNTKTTNIVYDKEGNFVTDEDGIPIQQTKLADWKNVTIRNNVFADNSVADLILSGYVNDVIFDNNTVIKTGKLKNEKVITTQDFYTGTPGDRWTISNNIFFMRKTNAARFSMEFSTTYTFNNNNYYGFEEAMMTTVKEVLKDKNAKVINPGFAADTAAANGIESAFGFKPTNSEILTSGIALKFMLEKDFAGNGVIGSKYLGAFGKLA